VCLLEPRDEIRAFVSHRASRVARARRRAFVARSS
jgi:hypothetical protein